MEKVIICNAVQHNQEVMNSEDYEIPEGTAVKVYNDAGPFDKVKPKILPGKWEVMNHTGVNYTVFDHESNTKLNLPRWKLDKLN
jgi:hypothetical protein